MCISWNWLHELHYQHFKLNWKLFVQMQGYDLFLKYYTGMNLVIGVKYKISVWWTKFGFFEIFDMPMR